MHFTNNLLLSSLHFFIFFSEIHMKNCILKQSCTLRPKQLFNTGNTSYFHSFILWVFNLLLFCWTSGLRLSSLMITKKRKLVLDLWEKSVWFLQFFQRHEILYTFWIIYVIQILEEERTKHRWNSLRWFYAKLTSEGYWKNLN